MRITSSSCAREGGSRELGRRVARLRRRARADRQVERRPLPGAPPIETEGLCKSYGDKQALLNLDLALRAGAVFGFIGPNCAGKPTTIRILMDLIRPGSGCGRVL